MEPSHPRHCGPDHARILAVTALYDGTVAQVTTFHSDPIVPRRQIADELGISPDTVGRLFKSRKIEWVQVSVRRDGARRSEIERYKREQTRPSQREGG